MYPITTITASLLTGLFIFLAVKVIRLRRRYKVSLGSGEYRDLEMAMRAHGNFSEYTPIALILMACAEMNGAYWFIVTFFALLFSAGRFVHAYAFLYNRNHLNWRVLGMMLTFIPLGGLAVLDLVMLGIHYF